MVTLKDVALRAGVNHSTVSYVLNGKAKEKRIAPATCERILQAAAELGYCPNANALAVKRGSSRIIGVLGSLRGEFIMDMLRGISDEAARRDFSLQPRTINAPKDIPVAVAGCRSYRCCGLIGMDFMPAEHAALKAAARTFGAPIVMVDTPIADPEYVTVNSDTFAGARDAVRHLIAGGHRRIGCIGIAELASRSAGYHAAMAEAGLRPQTGWVYEMLLQPNSGPGKFDAVAQTMEKMLVTERLSAIFCASDPLALQLFQVAAPLGIAIPDDLSVIGVAGMSYAQLGVPPLSSVSQPFYDMGRQTVIALEQKLSGAAVAPEIVLPTQLVLRRSHRSIARTA